MEIGREAKKCNVALWGPLNQSLYSCGDDGVVRIWDVETGKQSDSIHDHKGKINDLQFSKDRTMFITASSDHTARVRGNMPYLCALYGYLIEQADRLAFDD